MEGLLYRGVEVTVFDDQEIPALRRATDQAITERPELALRRPGNHSWLARLLTLPCRTYSRRCLTPPAPAAQTLSAAGLYQPWM